MATRIGGRVQTPPALKRRAIVGLSRWDGKLRTTKPRPARQSSSLSGNAQTSRRSLAMTPQAVGEISMPIHWRVNFQGNSDRFSIFVFWKID
jgi:hypothetical protein